MNSIATCGFCSKLIDAGVAIKARLKGEQAYCDATCERADKTHLELTVGAALLRQ
jgi:hypothetical protein